MSNTSDSDLLSASAAVFLSYASEDAVAAERFATALRAVGIEVWFDRSALRGGDLWDATIRKQIRQCALFVPLISDHVRTRPEGYFRLEWKLAVDRSQMMDAEHPFIVPVAIDSTSDQVERIPDKFREVQWTRAPDGAPPPGFVERVARLLRIATGADRSGGDAPHTASHHPETTNRVTAGSTGGAIAARPPAPAPAGRRWHLHLAAGLGLAAVVAAIGAGLIAYRHGSDRLVRPAPYSREDRRMTFAVVPFRALPGDPHGTAVAAATTDEVEARLQAYPMFAQAVPGSAVAQALARNSDTIALARALDVHFLIRGAVTPVPNGENVELSVVDGETGRTLQTKTLPVPGSAVVPTYTSDIDNALSDLEFEAIKLEVKRAESVPDDALDVRDLSYRALTYWVANQGGENEHTFHHVNALLRRALALAPDDPLATFLTASLNLCDCILAWSKNVAEQKRIGAAALDRFLRMDPNDPEMLFEKGALYELGGRYGDAVLVADEILAREPDDPDGQYLKASALLLEGQARAAVAILEPLARRFPVGFPAILALAADAEFEVDDYARSAKFAQTATTEFDPAELRTPKFGPVRLTLAAAEAHLGDLAEARAALQDFQAAVPTVRTARAIRAWMYATTALKNFAPFYAGLKKAGVPD